MFCFLFHIHKNILLQNRIQTQLSEQTDIKYTINNDFWLYVHYDRGTDHISITVIVCVMEIIINTLSPRFPHFCVRYMWQGGLVGRSERGGWLVCAACPCLCASVSQSQWVMASFVCWCLTTWMVYLGQLLVTSVTTSTACGDPTIEEERLVFDEG